MFNKNNFAMLVKVAENYTPIDWNSFKKKALWANIANYQKMEIIIGILAEMSTLPSLQVTIFSLHFEQLKYLNNYLSIRTLFKPWLYLSHLDVYNIVILSTAKKRLCQKKIRDWSCWSQSTFSNFHGRGEIAKKWDYKKSEI